MALLQTTKQSFITSHIDHDIEGSFLGGNAFHFLPDFTEHPKHLPRSTPGNDNNNNNNNNNNPKDEQQDENEVTFGQDFVAGGMAGCASIVVGHPFDTIKVRIQSSLTAGKSLATATPTTGITALWKEFGGISSLFRGMGAPLSAAAFINAIIFSSYGASSKIYDRIRNDDSNWEEPLDHDPWQKSMTCGSFAGLVQSIITCPMEHIKCRLQVQHGAGAPDYQFGGPLQAVRFILREHGIMRLYQGWWSTFWREIPAFGLYFVSYDMIKDKVNTYFSQRQQQQQRQSSTLVQLNRQNDPFGLGHSHTWLASAVAGGCAGSLTWAIVYPVDLIKTCIQTAPLTTPRRDLQLWNVGQRLVQTYGWRYLFRGLGVTLLRAFPVNGTIFPVYEFTLLHLRQWQGDRPR